MDFANLKFSVNQRVCTITMARPERQNALDAKMVAELSSAFSAAQKDADVKVVILCGEGDAFCQGLDVHYLQENAKYDFQQHQEESQNFMRLLSLIYAHRKPVIGVVRGEALGSGCGLVTVCDFVLASKETARFGFPEARLGLIPALVLLFLVRRIGEGRARELALRGQTISAEEGLRLGLVSGVVPETELDACASSIAQDLARHVSGSSMGLIKELLSRVHGMSTPDALEYAANLNALIRMTDESKRGVEALSKNETIRW